MMHEIYVVTPCSLMYYMRLSVRCELTGIWFKLWRLCDSMKDCKTPTVVEILALFLSGLSMSGGIKASFATCLFGV